MRGKDWVRTHMFGRAAVADPPAAGPADWLARLQLGPAHEVAGLEVWPLLHPSALAEADLLAAEAIAAGLVDIREKDGGTVQELTATNRASRPVILFEGDVLLGAKQNRMVAHTVVIVPGATIVVPVGCVERGRWAWRTQAFGSSGRMAEAALRRSAKVSLSAARGTSGRAALDQQALWAEVDVALAGSGVHSPTSDYVEVQGRRAADEAQVARIAPLERQVGVIGVRDGALVGLDLAGSTGTWRAVAQRVTASLLPVARPGAHARHRDAAVWLADLQRARLVEHPAAGAGRMIEVLSDTLVGSGVWLDARFVHLSAFERV